MFKGVATALITPFTSSGVDYEAYRRLIESQIAGGVSALLVLGTTGEAATMSEQERIDTIKFAIEVIAKRVPVIVGTGSNCTAQAISNSVLAEKLGADMLLVVTPYYNKCTQNGLIEHYALIAEAVNIPIIAYNVPGRTGMNIAPATVKALAGIPNIKGIKEASGNLSQMAEIIKATQGMDFDVYSGDDGLAVPAMSLGASGLISVASNVAPKAMSDMIAACIDGDYDKARSIYYRYHRLFKVLFMETNPIPVKFACSKLGFGDNIVRMPLTPASEVCSAEVADAMYELNLL